MIKRDYVNLQEIEKQAKSPNYKGTISVNAISEQEIVKPYLDKLKAELVAAHYEDDSNIDSLLRRDMNSINKGLDLAITYIDHLFTEYKEVQDEM